MVLHACLQCTVIKRLARFVRDFDKVHAAMIGDTIELKLLLSGQRS